MHEAREQPREQSGAQSPEPKPRSQVGTAILIAVAFAATIVVAAMILRGAPSSGVPAERRPLPGGNPIAEIMFPPTFPLLLDSTPDGADVYEGDRRIGSTPLRLVLDNATLNAHPRRFRIDRRGFRSLFVTQGPSTDPVRIVAALIPE